MKNRRAGSDVLFESRTKLMEITKSNNLDDARVSVSARALIPEHAIGAPARKDFPIIIGKERMVEVEVRGAKAHVFTDSPGEFTGTVKEVLGFTLTSSRERAIYTGTVSAILKSLGLVENTIHCKDEEPEKCGRDIASKLLQQCGNVRVGLIGFNPAIAQNLVETFGVECVKITDLNEDNIGKLKFGVKVWDGREMTEELIERSDIILVSGTTLVNGTFDGILDCIKTFGKDYLIYGVTGSGICGLMGFRRICPYSKTQ